MFTSQNRIICMCPEAPMMHSSEERNQVTTENSANLSSPVLTKDSKVLTVSFIRPRAVWQTYIYAPAPGTAMKLSTKHVWSERGFHFFQSKNFVRWVAPGHKSNQDFLATRQCLVKKN